MVTVIKKGTNKKEIEKLLSNIKSEKKFDAYKYLGIIKVSKDPVEIQKKLRDEFDFWKIKSNLQQ